MHVDEEVYPCDSMHQKYEWSLLVVYMKSTIILFTRTAVLPYCCLSVRCVMIG